MVGKAKQEMDRFEKKISVNLTKRGLEDLEKMEKSWMVNRSQAVRIAMMEASRRLERQKISD